MSRYCCQYSVPCHLVFSPSLYLLIEAPHPGDSGPAERRAGVEVDQLVLLISREKLQRADYVTAEELAQRHGWVNRMEEGRGGEGRKGREGA